MTHFTVGEEVLFEDRRYVVSTIEPDPPGRVRLLATTPDGARVVWSTRSRLAKIDAYTRPNDDTERNAWQG
jgi:hypothetical protein